MRESSKVGVDRSGLQSGGVELGRRGRETRWFGSVRCEVYHDERRVVLLWSAVKASMNPAVRAGCVKWACSRLAEDLPGYEVDLEAVT